MKFNQLVKERENAFIRLNHATSKSAIDGCLYEIKMLDCKMEDLRHESIREYDTTKDNLISRVTRYIKQCLGLK